MQKVSGSATPSRESGGTAHILPLERKKASFDPKKLYHLIYGGAEKSAQESKWNSVFSPEKNPLFDFTYDVLSERKELFQTSLARTFASHKLVKANPDMLQEHMKGAMTGRGGYGIGPKVQSSSSAAGNHYGIFVNAILAQASEEQKQEWFNRAINLKILGAYAQTELGHGSNVRGLETTATYDPATEEFVLDSPTLTSMKWWPGCFGLLATHSVVYARLILKGKDYGVHSFMVQLRDEDHRCLPGIEVGDVGPKMGYNLVDNGYCRFDHVRIPRNYLLSKYQHVTKEGEYVKTGAIKKDDQGVSGKLGHIVMISTRVGLTYGAFSVLAKASTIGIRYSAVRHQGYKNTRENSQQSGELPVLDYQVQQYRLFKWLSMCFAFFFGAQYVRSQLVGFYEKLQKGDVSDLPELHATAAEFKAFCTNYAGDGIEEIRRCCGGHGTLMSGGIAKIVSDYNTIAPIAEGDKIVLALQGARHLVRAVQNVRAHKPVPLANRFLEEEIEVKWDNLLDLQTLVQIFKWRAKNSAFHAADQLQARLKQGLQFDEAWNGTAIDLVQAAEHHCFYILVNGFAEGVNKIEDLPLKKVLHNLALHFALVQLKEHSGDWVPLITSAVVRQVDQHVAHLLKAIRPEAVAIVDGFGFSDNTLQSALGRSDGNVYEALYDYAKKYPMNSPEYLQQLYDNQLRHVLDREYIKQGKAKQRAGSIVSKL